jgi:hypothetical protein
VNNNGVIFELFELIGYRDVRGADDDLAVIATVSFAKILARG